MSISSVPLSILGGGDLFKCFFLIRSLLYHFLILCICCVLKIIENMSYDVCEIMNAYNPSRYVAPNNFLATGIGGNPASNIPQFGE